MSLFTDFRAAVRAIADGRSDTAKLSLGTPGDTVPIVGEDKPTGAAWGANKAMQIVMEGIAQVLDAAFSPNRRAVTGSITASVDDDILAVTSLPGGGLAIELPTAGVTAGKHYIVKDETGGAAGPDPIALTGESGETIDGAGAASITTAYGALHIYAGGGNWWTY